MAIGNKKRRSMRKTALVTGGAQGLGEEIVRLLADNGMNVIIGDIQQEKAQALAGELRNSEGEVTALRLNLTDAVAVQKTFSQIVETYTRLDVLINNAGTDVSKPVTDMTLEEFDRVMGVNLRGAFLLSKLMLQQQIEGGSIVNIVSTAAKRAWPNAAAYHASKWGLLGLSQALFTEARDKKIKVTALIAGGMRTPFITDRFPDVDLNVLQDPVNVAKAVLFVLNQPEETVIPELMVLPLTETSWP
jgi:NAD(P)-dependent dehydrogenase (short-subunit alcohol dehydrogenase family)